MDDGLVAMPYIRMDGIWVLVSTMNGSPLYVEHIDPEYMSSGTLQDSDRTLRTQVVVLSMEEHKRLLHAQTIVDTMRQFSGVIKGE